MSAIPPQRQPGVHWRVRQRRLRALLAAAIALFFVALSVGGALTARSINRARRYARLVSAASAYLSQLGPIEAIPASGRAGAATAADLYLKGDGLLATAVLNPVGDCEIMFVQHTIRYRPVNSSVAKRITGEPLPPNPGQARQIRHIIGAALTLWPEAARGRIIVDKLESLSPNSTCARASIAIYGAKSAPPSVKLEVDMAAGKIVSVAFPAP